LVADLALGDAPLPLGSAVIFTSTGIVSSLKLPVAMAARAFLWELAENWSGLLQRDAKFARDVFRAEAHVDVGVGIIVDEPRDSAKFCCRP